MIYGGEIPSNFILAYSGFHDTDNIDSLDVRPRYITLAEEMSDVGNYGFELEEGEDEFYLFRLETAGFRILKDTVTVLVFDADISWQEDLSMLSIDDLSIGFETFNFPEKDLADTIGNVRFIIPEGNYAQDQTGTVTYKAEGLTHPNYVFGFDSAEVTIHRWPSIEVQPTSLQQCERKDTLLTVEGIADPVTLYQWKYRNLTVTDPKFEDLSDDISMNDFPFDFSGSNTNSLEIKSILVSEENNIEDYDFRVRVFGAEKWSGPPALSSPVTVGAKLTPPKSVLMTKFDRILINTDNSGSKYYWGVSENTIDSTAINEYRFTNTPIDETFWSSICYDNGCCTKTFYEGDAIFEPEESEEILFQVFPNPGTGENLTVSITNSYEGFVDLVVRNLDGSVNRELESIEKKSNPFDPSLSFKPALPTGIYFLDIDFGTTQRSILKFVVK